MATLTVGTNKQYATIAAATAAARDGDTVSVSAGTYVNDFATIRTRITLVSVGGPATMLATVPSPNARALLTVTTDATIDGFVFTGARTADGTAAGLRYEGGALVVRNSLFSGNQNGLLALPDPNGTILIQASEFARNGNNDGLSYNVNVGAVKALTIQNSYIHDAAGGSEVKSRALATSISGSRIQDQAGASGYAIDLPNGGAATIQNNTIQKGAASTTAAAIRFGGDVAYAASALNLTGNVIVSDRPAATLLLNQTTKTASLASNQTYGFAAIATGPASTFANTTPPARPNLSTATLVAPATALPVEYGRAGAVVANGTVLTVGAAGTYATVAAAVAAAHDGDTIRVAAGTYVNDTATITRKVIIEGIGGLARFVSTVAPATGLAQFVTTTDATFRNVEIFGAATPGGVAAAIRDQGGNLTIVNSTIHDNQSGVVADKDTSGSLAIYDSEIARNGTPDGRGANIDAAEVGTLTLRNDYIHDAVAGPELRSRADNTVLDVSRISQAAGNGGAAIELPDAGRVSITDSAIEKGANSQSATLIQIGGDAIYAGSSVSLSGNTLISALTTAPTTFVANNAAAVPVTATNTTYAGGVAGSIQVKGGANTGATIKTGVTVNTTSPYGNLSAPAAAPLLTTVAAPAASPSYGVLILRISEDAWRGDAQFSLLVDGAPVAGVLTATANHGAGLSQTFTIAGPFAPGAHSVSVKFLNDLKGGAPGEDRNLYVDGMTFNGAETGASAALTANGTAVLSTVANTRPTAVTVNLSEDAWKGDAMAFISIDGRVQGGVQTVTASHALGRTQAMSFLLDLAPGPHTASVTYLNDAGGEPGQDRNLYIDSIDVAGVHYAAAATALMTNGTSAFAFTLAPPPAANGSLFVTAGLPQPLALMIPTP